MFLICFHHLFTVKCMILHHAKTQVDYTSKMQSSIITSQRLCNRIAFCMANLHFSSRFTVICWRKKTTVKLDRKKQRQVGVGGWGFLALSLSKKHSPSPCDWLAGWVVVGLGWLVGWLAGWLVGWLVGCGWLVGKLVGWWIGWLAGWLAGHWPNKLQEHFHWPLIKDLIKKRKGIGPGSSRSVSIDFS